jgi:hypothetical protein
MDYIAMLYSFLWSNTEGLQLSREKSEMEIAFKVVAIMQTITEELDESSKKMWRKIFGIPEATLQSKHVTRKTKSEKKK